MKSVVAFLVLFFSLVANCEIRLGSGNGKDLKIRSEEFSKIISSLKESGYFSQKVELNKDDLFEILDEKTGFITNDGKRYLIIDADLIDKIQFSEMNIVQENSF